MARISALAFAIVIATVSLRAQSGSFDWPQWRGPDRNGISKETGLLKQWPRSGPPLAWSAAMLGAGYGSIAVKGYRLWVQGMRNRQSVVISLNRADGKVAWVTIIGPAAENDRGNGPRSTPTVDGDRLYALTENGDLASLRVTDGGIVWQRNIIKEFGGRNIGWLLSESPLVDGPHLVVTPGGRIANVNATFARWVGAPADQLVGQPLRAVSRNRSAIVRFW